MPFKLAKTIFQAFTMAAVLSIKGQTSFNFDVVQASLAFDLKVTITPKRNNAQVAPKRPTLVLPLTYSPYLAANHKQGSVSLVHIDRLRTIMRNWRILCPGTPRTK